VDPAEGTTPVLALVANKSDVPAMAAAIVSGSPTICIDVGVGFEVLKMAIGGIMLAGGITPIAGADGVRCAIVPVSINI